jgi:signal transduction histidine kinase/CheY-like chemotaxis protein
MRFSGADEGWIFVYHPEDSTFEYKAIAGQDAFGIGTRIAGSTGISAEVWRTGQTALIDDYSLWPKRDTARAYNRRRATVAIPFRSEGKLSGILGMAHNDPDRCFEPEEVAILERLAELASIALDNTLLYDRMKQELAERRQAEEENLRLVERLQRSEKMEALGQLAGGVAHDLNNVLGILSGYSELLLLELPGGSRSRDYADKILESTRKGASIIQDLLTLARRGVTASEVVNLNDVVGSFLKSPVFEKLREYHPRIAFLSDCDPNLLNIKGSPVHLEKTVMNLMTNAAESISGRGEVTLRTESRYLDKAIGGYDEVREGEYAVLTVSDTGMGIPPENRERIFEPFYTNKAMGRSGTGLGLTIVWGTVRDHNGYIDVQTEVGRGTTFTLYFPVSREKAAALPDREPADRYVGKGEKVLVVDDIAEQREVASGLIGRLGYSVHAVPGGEEAVAYLRDNRADILVLDMIMTPGMDGLETYQRILEINPRQRAILVSGFSQTDRVREAQRLGAGAYIKKPYVLETIGMALREELDRPEKREGG